MDKARIRKPFVPEEIKVCEAMGDMLEMIRSPGLMFWICSI
jgi:hypothetical protein